MDVVLLVRVDLPHRFAVGDGQAVEHPLRTVDVDAVVIDHRAGPRAGAVAVHGPRSSVWYSNFQRSLPVSALRQVRRLLSPKRSKWNSRPRLIDGRGEADAHRSFPDDLEPFPRPLREDPLLGRDAVRGRPEERAASRSPALRVPQVGRRLGQGRECDNESNTNNA